MARRFLPVLAVTLVLIVIWEVAASLYFDANVAQQFRAGAISGADPTVPPEMRVVQMILGHSSMRTTEVYAHVMPELMADAMARLGTFLELSAQQSAQN